MTSPPPPEAASAPPSGVPEQGKPTAGATVAPARSAPKAARTVEVRLMSPEEKAKKGAELLESLKTTFPVEVLEITQRPGILARIRFQPEAVLRLGQWLRDQGSFAHCAMVAGIDWRETVEVVYSLWSDSLNMYLELSAFLPTPDPHVESVSGIWFGANWHEREAWEFLGIRFDHHPDLRHLLLEEGYKFHPLLKSFELHEPEELEVKARLGR